MFVDVLVYNQSTIQSWENELLLLLPNLSEKSKLVDKLRKTLEPYERELDPINLHISQEKSKLNSVESRITQERAALALIESRISRINLQLNNAVRMNAEHRHHHSSVHNHPSTHGSINVDVTALQRQLTYEQAESIKQYQYLERLESDRKRIEMDLIPWALDSDRIQRSMEPHQTQFNEASSDLKQLTNQQLFLEKHISAGKLFLQELKNNPQKLVFCLAETLRNQFKKYENKNFQTLIPQVRICLISVREGLNGLINYGKEGTPELHRANYLRLSGFLDDMYSQVKGQDHEFELLLVELIKNTHVPQLGDLPDEFKTGKTANTWFNEAKDKNPQYLAIQFSDLNTIEEEMVQKKLSALQSSHLMEFNNIKHIAVSVDEEIKKKKDRQEPVDYPFYYQMLRSAEDLAKNPKDTGAMSRLEAIAAVASGRPSVGKKVLGSILVVLGVLLIAASIALFACTLGLGAGLGTLGIVSGIAASTEGVGLGTGTTFFGINRIKYGQRQGLSLELMNIKAP